jgi:hypothetical protein
VADTLDEYFQAIGEEGEFAEKVTGYCVVYNSLAVVFLELMEDDLLDRIFVALNDSVIQNATTKEGALIEAVYIPYQTEEIPIKSFYRWYKVQPPTSNSLKEIKQITKVEERIMAVYEGMLEVGQILRDAEDQKKNQDAFKRIFTIKTGELIPAGDELMSIAGPEI